MLEQLLCPNTDRKTSLDKRKNPDREQGVVEMLPVGSGQLGTASSHMDTQLQRGIMEQEPLTMGHQGWRVAREGNQDGKGLENS